MLVRGKENKMTMMEKAEIKSRSSKMAKYLGLKRTEDYMIQLQVSSCQKKIKNKMHKNRIKNKIKTRRMEVYLGLKLTVDCTTTSQGNLFLNRIIPI